MRSYNQNIKNLAFSIFVLFSFFLFATNSIFAEENSEKNSRMPHVVTPLVTSSSPNSLYTPGKTNIIEIPAKNRPEEEDFSEKNISNEEPVEKSEQPLEKRAATSADFIKLKSLGFLANIKKMLTEKNIKLSSIISELDNAKKSFDSSQKGKSPIENEFGSNVTLTKTALTNASFMNSEEEVSIIRFEVNGQNIQPACYNLYFSGIEQNGAFLLTGDFRYLQETRPCTETFYFLFTAEGMENGKLVYKVTSSVDQDFKNENSPLIAVSKIEDLNAYKTGGFISIHDSKDDVAIDFLLTLKSTALSHVGL